MTGAHVDDRVWGVVTAFRPDADLVDAVQRLLPQTDGVVVVDDGSGPDSAPIFDTLICIGAKVIHLETNSGIAAALNRGIQCGLDAGADAVVTFDQDSHVGDDFVRALRTARRTALDAGVGVGPVVPEFFAGVRQVHGRIGVALTARHVIQSGMLLHRDVFAHVGDMSESLFIDLVDTEYELRCLDARLTCVAAPGLRLEHSLGAQYRAPGLLPLPVLTLSTPFRYFYRARNRVIIDKRFGRRHPARILRDSTLDRVHFALAWWVARPRRAFWRLMRAGSAAGRRGEGGPIPSELNELARTITWAADRVR